MLRVRTATTGVDRHRQHPALHLRGAVGNNALLGFVLRRREHGPHGSNCAPCKRLATGSIACCCRAQDLCAIRQQLLQVGAQVSQLIIR